ncbi:hypothetical protein S7335_554 [Synechococcus sp. PCC 7335]|uniref:hypothetical protein n=1 Tax=Synechococcus sp. (strain ATCC 29403 / PCC 7335) TaxID=91464 RepID=UPI00017EC7E5|nr:hypothetical protein [Synechococcus sp. PCC 7335]EDX83374.1 hypothetical protein S7335_554 [Synechococcus sp. PCC 7335]
MLNLIRYSQMVDLVAIDSGTSEYLGPIRDVWVDDTGRIVYLSSDRGYIPLIQVAGVSTQAVSTRGLLIQSPPLLHRLKKLPIAASTKDNLEEFDGWVEDFLFDWQTGEVTHYILAGKIAKEIGDRAVLAAEKVKTITAKAVVVEDDAQANLQSEASGLRGFLSEKQCQVRQLVHELSDRLHHQISADDTPQVVHVKIKAAGDDIAATNHPNQHLLAEAINFLHDHWEILQRSVRQANSRTQQALSSTWKQLTTKSS